MPRREKEREGSPFDTDYLFDLCVSWICFFVIRDFDMPK
jgi:hypothetical protein